MKKLLVVLGLIASVALYAEGNKVEVRGGIDLGQEFNHNYWNLQTGEMRLTGVGVGARNYVRQSNTLDFENDAFQWFFTYNSDQAILNGNNMEVLQHG